MDLGPYLIFASLEGLVHAAVLSLIALGLSLVFGVMRIVNVAHGEFFMLGAILTWWVSNFVMGNPALGFLLALLIVPLVVGIIAMFSDLLILRHLKYDPEVTIIATIGILYIIQQFALMTFGPDARPVEQPFNIRLDLYWFGFSAYKFFVIFSAIILLFCVWLVMAKTKFGLILRATQLDSEIAQAFGIPISTVYSLVFGVGAAIAAVGAVLIVPIQQAHYLMGGEPLLLAFIVVIIGGLGSLKGTVVAAMLIGISDGIISVFFSPNLAKILATLLVVVVLLIRPNGLFRTIRI
ncbi:MAG: branched-chain amino acid ABC transporter permease [Pseudomonadota bacterium]|nr:branched-chain amino acid ABC transporter permease [Pseudomonadota bacterium]